MAVQRISEKQFRTRRRDRRMVWVDALAFLIGLLIVTASVGGVLFYEPEVEPIEWAAQFNAMPVYDQRTCIGFDGSVGSGCSIPIREEIAKEGEPIEFRGWAPITQANVTEVSFRLSWLDNAPRTGENCEEFCGRNFNYNESSTDILRLEVHTPWGEVFVEEDMNVWENVSLWMHDSNQGQPPTGSIRITVPVMDPPEMVTNLSADSQRDAEAKVNATHWVGDHDAIGEWKTVVTIVRAGDIQGTSPTDICEEAGLSEDERSSLPDDEETCGAFYEAYVLASSEGTGGGGVPTRYPGLYGPEARPIMEQTYDHYYSSWKDPGNSWTLSMTVRAYEGAAGVL